MTRLPVEFRNFYTPAISKLQTSRQLFRNNFEIFRNISKLSQFKMAKTRKGTTTKTRKSKSTKKKTNKKKDEPIEELPDSPLSFNDCEDLGVFILMI